MCSSVLCPAAGPSRSDALVPSKSSQQSTVLPACRVCEPAAHGMAFLHSCSTVCTHRCSLSLHTWCKRSLRFVPEVCGSCCGSHGGGEGSVGCARRCVLHGIRRLLCTHCRSVLASGGRCVQGLLCARSCCASHDSFLLSLRSELPFF